MIWRLDEFLTPLNVIFLFRLVSLLLFEFITENGSVIEPMDGFPRQNSFFISQNVGSAAYEKITTGSGMFVVFFILVELRHTICWSYHEIYAGDKFTYLNFDFHCQRHASFYKCSIVRCTKRTKNIATNSGPIRDLHNRM